MKTLLIVLAIIALLGVVVFLLICEHKIGDEEISQPDSDVSQSDSDDTKVDVSVPEDTDKPKDTPEDTEHNRDSFIEEGFNELDATQNNEVNIPEHCKPKEEPIDNLPNKYFFNIHKYTTAKRMRYCVVCNAVIKGHNYRVIVLNSFYPYIKSYTKTLCATIVSKYSGNMTVEEFLKTGSNKFDRVGEIVDALPYVY